MRIVWELLDGVARCKYKRNVWERIKRLTFRFSWKSRMKSVTGVLPSNKSSTIICR